MLRSIRKIPVNHRLLLILLSAIALFLRIEYISNTVIDEPIRADAAQYVFYGYNLSHYGIYSKNLPGEVIQPDSFRSPGYPLLIALLFSLGGERNFYAMVLSVQAVLSALMVPLTYALGSMFLPGWAAFASAFLVAICPHLVSMSNYLLTEILFGFVLLSAIFFLCHALKNQSVFCYLLGGLLFGYAYLTNETALFVPFVLIGIIVLSYSRNVDPLAKKKFSMGIAIFFFAFVVFPLAWSLRNASSLPPDTPKGSDRALSTLTHGTYPDFIYKDPLYKYYPYREDPMQPAFGETIGNFSRIFWSRFRERPGRYLSWYLLEKPYYLWSWSILQGQGDVYVYAVIKSYYYDSVTANGSRVAMKVLHPVVLVLALTAALSIIFRCRRGTGRVDLADIVPLLLCGFCLYYTLLYAIFAPWPRYSIPLRPELYLLALWMVVYLKEKKRQEV